MNERLREERKIKRSKYINGVLHSAKEKKMEEKAGQKKMKEQRRNERKVKEKCNKMENKLKKKKVDLRRNWSPSPKQET